MRRLAYRRGKGRPRMCYIGEIIKDVREKKHVNIKRLGDRRAVSNRPSYCRPMTMVNK